MVVFVSFNIRDRSQIPVEDMVLARTSRIRTCFFDRNPICCVRNKYFERRAGPLLLKMWELMWVCVWRHGWRRLSRVTMDQAVGLLVPRHHVSFGGPPHR